MSRSAGSLTGLRQRNRRQVLEVLRHRGTTSRAEIARQTGLSTTTVSTLVCALLDDGVVVELADRTDGSASGGRPRRMISFNPSAGGAVGVHLGHEHVRIGVTDLAGDIVARSVTELDVDHEPVATLDFTGAESLRLIRQSGLRAAGIVGLGVAVSAPVAAATHALGSELILADWHGVDVAGELGRRTGLRIELGNDANLGAIAEHRSGVAQDVDDFVYVMLSDGVGAGLVLGGSLYEGAIGGAGELGHVQVVANGFICRCGNRGCLETVAGARAIATAMTLTRGTTNLADVLAAAGAGDEGARRALADAGHAVGRALVPICTVLDPALIVVGGDSCADPSLLRGVREALGEGITPMRRNAIPVRAGALGDDAEMLGAAALVTQSMSLA